MSDPYFAYDHVMACMCKACGHLTLTPFGTCPKCGYRGIQVYYQSNTTTGGGHTIIVYSISGQM